LDNRTKKKKKKIIKKKKKKNKKKKKRIIKETEKIDVKLILMISKNIDQKNIKRD